MGKILNKKYLKTKFLTYLFLIIQVMTPRLDILITPMSSGSFLRKL